MKTTLLVQTVPTGMKNTLTLGAALMLLASAQMARGGAAAELLERGIYAEETKGELSAASQMRWCNAGSLALTPSNR